MSTSRSLLDRHILGTLLVLHAVQERPSGRTRVLLALQVGELGLAVDECERFAIRLHVVFTVARVNFKTGKNAGFGPVAVEWEKTKTVRLETFSRSHGTGPAKGN